MRGTDLRFAVLGPVRAWRGEGEINLGSPQQQAVLAALLLREGTQTTMEELVAGLWGEQPPRTATGTVRTYISRLRRALDEGRTDGESAIVPVARGYALPCQDVDVFRFRRLTRQASQALTRHEFHAAAGDLREALELWRGTALAGLTGPYAQAQRARLTHLRLAAMENRIAADIQLGHHAEALADLAVLVAADPLSERLRELQMLALYRSGRQADALHTYHSTRRLLSEELGISPGHTLSHLHQRILTNDPLLSARRAVGASS